jgi:membrane-associated phospholipid phosphatase
MFSPTVPDPGRSGRRIGRLGVAAGVLAGTTAIAAGGVPRWESDLFERVNELPHRLEPVLWAPMQLGSLVAPVVVAGGSWAAFRRWRPAVGSLVCGVSAWQTAKVIKEAIGRGRPKDAVAKVVTRQGTPTDGLGFVSGHTAVAAAVAVVLSPYLPRPARLAVGAVPVVVAVARIHVAAHLPLDTVGGAALGIVIGDVFNLVVGVPHEDRPGR